MANKQLLFSVTIKDCDVQTFCSGGPGGQHQNKVASGVRVIHRPSGAIGESRETRSQHTNKRLAFERMANCQKFKNWARLEASRLMGRPSPEAVVDAMMEPENLKVEIKDDQGKWVEE